MRCTLQHTESVPIQNEPALAALQARLRRAERRAVNGGLGACAFTFLHSLSPSVFARSPGISLAEVVASAAEREDAAPAVRSAFPQEETGGNFAAECLE